MTVPARLATFAVAVVAAFALAFGVGRAGAGPDAVDPAPVDAEAPTDATPDDEARHDGTGHDTGTDG